jgi:hypothetical protein
MAVLAAWSPAHARSGGGATLIFSPGHSSGQLYINGVGPTTYTGGNIPGEGYVSIYGRSSSGALLYLGLETRSNGGLLEVNDTPTNSGGSLTLTAGDTFVSGSTLTIANGSTATFGGELSLGNNYGVGNNPTLNLTGGLLKSGVPIVLGGTSTITTSGTLTLNGTLSGTSSILEKSGTLDLGTGSGINGGTLTVNGLTTINNSSFSAGLLTLNSGSTITNANTLNVNTGSGTLGVITVGSLYPGSGTISLFPTTGTIIGGGTITLGPLGGYGSGILNLGNPFTLGGNQTLTISEPGTVTIANASVLSSIKSIILPVSTQLTLAVPTGIALNALPAFTGAAATTGGTKSSFLGGVDSKGGTIALSYLPAVQTLASDPLSLHISELDAGNGFHEKFVLEMSYNSTAALDPILEWLNPNGNTWQNAVDANSDGGASAHFVAGAYNSNADFNLGYYGVDTANDVAWAVLDTDGTLGSAST